MELFALTQIAVNYEMPLPQYKRSLFPHRFRLNWIGMAAFTASLSVVFAAPGAIALVERGDQGPEVTKLQTELEQAGYSVGGVDGIFGPGTENAVRVFQSEYGLVADGIAGNITLGKLAEVSSGTSTTASAGAGVGPTETDNDASAPEPETTDIGFLRVGDRGDAVADLQRELANLGYFSSRTFGYYGPVTKAAVEAFQSKNSLGVDGVAGPVTQTRLYGDGAIASDAVTTLNAGEVNESTTAQSSQDDGLLALGNSGNAVVALQDQLKALDYFPDTLNSTGYFGPVTQDAVEAFQQANRLPVDGVVGPVTLQVLSSAEAVPASPVPTPASTPEPSVSEPDTETITVATTPSTEVVGDRPLSAGRVVTVAATSGLNVRTAPSPTAAIDRTLDDGTSVELSGERVDTWLELSDGGWVDSRFVLFPAG